YFRLYDTDQDRPVRREQDNDGSNDCASATCTYPSLTTAAVGTLSVDIVDSGGSSVTSPSVTFGAKTFSFETQTSTGTLGTSSQKVRVSNTTSTPNWTLSIAATTGPTTLWTTGSITYDFNGSAANGRLTVNAAGGTITPQGGCATTGLTLGSSTAFAQGTQDSVDLLTAGGSAQTSCYWDVTNVSLTQDIPATQANGTYTISMTITVS
ncbi:MAG: hypothetical protein HY341_02750, partial [Candidatus Kerfeldbacteria bacterium]|nr:hypothetical protein [Candidatus Kerfeldbacteria bacterium]